MPPKATASECVQVAPVRSADMGPLHAGASEREETRRKKEAADKDKLAWRAIVVAPPGTPHEPPPTPPALQLRLERCFATAEPLDTEGKMFLQSLATSAAPCGHSHIHHPHPRPEAETLDWLTPAAAWQRLAEDVGGPIVSHC